MMTVIFFSFSSKATTPSGAEIIFHERGGGQNLKHPTTVVIYLFVIYNGKPFLIFYSFNVIDIGIIYYYII